MLNLKMIELLKMVWVAKRKQLHSPSYGIYIIALTDRIALTESIIDAAVLAISHGAFLAMTISL